MKRSDPDAAPRERQYSRSDTRIRRTPRFTLSALGVAVLALFLIATGMIATRSAAAQTTNEDGSETIYTGSLTVAATTAATGSLGFRRAGAIHEGTLSTETFAYDGAAYQITRIATDPTANSNTGELTIADTVSRSLATTDSVARWVLHLDSQSYAFSEADEKDIAGSTIAWHGVTNTDLGWGDGDTVAVKITRGAVPNAPTSVTTSNPSSSQIGLSWTAPTKNGGLNITGYKVEVSADSGDNWTTLIADTESTLTSYLHSGLTPGDTRHYRISALNSAGTGSASDTASGTAIQVTNEDGSETIYTGSLTVATTTAATGSLGFRRAGAIHSRGHPEPRNFRLRRDRLPYQSAGHRPDC